MAKRKELTAEQQKLFQELTKMAKRANQRLVRLERTFGEGTWASKKLRNRLVTEPLQAWTSSGRIKVNKSMTVTQMRAVLKATNQFLNSKTSTIKGIKEVRKTTIKAIATSMSIDEEKLTDDEAMTLYDMLSDDYVRDIIRYIPASEFWALIEEAKEMQDSEDDFISRISDYIEFGNDLDMREKLEVIYEKYVR